MQLQIFQDELLNAYGEVVTKNGFPLNLTESSGWEKNLNPITNAFHLKILINVNNVKNTFINLLTSLGLQFEIKFSINLFV